jgi:hypothetical protein
MWSRHKFTQERDMTGSKSNPPPKWVVIVIALQVMTVLGQWIGSPRVEPAMAQVPDAGLQRIQIIDQLKGTNDRLDKLIALLSGGNLQVKVAKPDESKGK